MTQRTRSSRRDDVKKAQEALLESERVSESIRATLAKSRAVQEQAIPVLRRAGLLRPR
jgi:hypothetical protein